MNRSACLFLISFAVSLAACSDPVLNSQPATADDYLLLGIGYKKAGRVEKSREALNKAIELGPDTNAGNSARQFLKLNLPVHPISLEAEQRNIIGFNQVKNGDREQAIKTFKELIRDFPDFEWPYGNLAAIYIKDHQVDEAEKLLEQALKINPSYMNGWRYMRQVRALQKDRQGVQDCTDRIQELEAPDGATSPRAPSAGDSRDSKF